MRLPHVLALVIADGIAPAISRWADKEERRILREGKPLVGEEILFARGLGIMDAEAVRVMELRPIPLPVPAWLLDFGRRLGFPFFAPAGMALGRGIYLLPGNRASLRHELVHVMQYQMEGGIRPFMHRYLVECMTVGYIDSPLEVEARNMGG